MATGIIEKPYQSDMADGILQFKKFTVPSNGTVKRISFPTTNQCYGALFVSGIATIHHGIIFYGCNLSGSVVHTEVGSLGGLTITYGSFYMDLQSNLNSTARVLLAFWDGSPPTVS